MQKSEQIAELADALSKAQGEMKPAVKDSVNPFFKSKYADLSSDWEACREPLAKNGIAVVQCPSSGQAVDGPVVHVETILIHKSGQWISETLSAIPTKADPQGIGSVITYIRRYSLEAMVGIAREDDDGNAASAPLQEPKARVALPPKTVPMSSSFAKFLASMDELKKLVGEPNYYTVLSRRGFSHANEIKGYSDQVEIYKELELKAKELLDPSKK